MVLAEKQLEEELFIPSTKESKQNKIKSRQKLIFTSLVFIFSILLINLLIARGYSLLTIEQTLISKQQELKELQLVNQQLNEEVIRLASLSRIESIATVKLGMTFPKDLDKNLVPPDTVLNLEQKETKNFVSPSPRKEKEISFLSSIKEMIIRTIGSLT